MWVYTVTIEIVYPESETGNTLNIRTMKVVGRTLAGACLAAKRKLQDDLRRQNKPFTDLVEMSGVQGDYISAIDEDLK